MCKNCSYLQGDERKKQETRCHFSCAGAAHRLVRMVVVVTQQGAASTLTKLQNAKSPKRNVTQWRNRDAEEPFVHIAESYAHQEWLRRTLEIRGSSASFDAAKHVVWLDKQRDKDRSEEHTAWLHGQKTSAEQVKNTANCHEDWLKDMQMPLREMDGGAYQDQLMTAAASYVQSLWRGRATRVGRAASVVNELSRRSTGDESLTNRRSIEKETVAETSSDPYASGPIDRTIDVAVVQESPPRRRSRAGVPSGCLGRASKRDKALKSPTSRSPSSLTGSPGSSRIMISSSEV